MNTDVTRSIWLAALAASIVVACGDVDKAELVEVLAADVSNDSPLAGGAVLSDSDVRRAGLFEISTEGRDNGCGAIVLSTSGINSETWLLSSAHCFDGAVAPGECRFEGTLSRVLSGDRTFLSGRNAGEVCVSPDFVAGPNRHDFATVRFPFGVSVEAPDGTLVQEYRRPIQGANPLVLSGGRIRAAVFGSGGSSGGEYDRTCGQAPRTDDDTFRYGTGLVESEGRGTIQIDQIDGGATRVLQGDSGAPWMSALRYSSPSLSQYLDDGLVVGVNSLVQCKTLGITSDVDYNATSTWGDKNTSFLAERMGGELAVVWNTSWIRTCFANWCEYTDVEKASLITASVL
ncbi:MAG: hypothetical protein AAFQ65_06125 [Myxococcota bacterium]